MTTDRTIDHEIWSSVTEETILLHDGLKYVVEGVVPPPFVSNSSTFVDCEFRFETTCIAELGKRLLAACAVQHSLYHSYFTFRQRALIKLWMSQKKDYALTQNSCASTSGPSGWDEAKLELDSRGKINRASFTSHVSLLLLLPLLESQSRIEPSLAVNCTDLLLHCLRERSPNSLRTEPESCINGLEKLLCSWLEVEDTQQHSGNEAISAQVNFRKESIIAALIALACGRLSVRSFTQVLCMLQKHKPSLSGIPVCSVFSRALEYEQAGQYASPTMLQTSHHITSWKFELFSGGSPDSASWERCPSLASNGKFLYATATSGKRLVKIGTGRHGTLRGYIYATNMFLEDGWVAWSNGCLLYRPQSFDAEKDNFSMLLDPTSLEVLGTVKLRDPAVSTTDKSFLQFKTVQFTSDSIHLYWIYTSSVDSTDLTDKSSEQKHFDITVWEFMLEEEENMGSTSLKMVAVPVGSCLTINSSKRKDVEIDSHSVQSSALFSQTKRLPENAAAHTESNEGNIDELLRTNIQQTPMFISSDMLVCVIPHIPTANTLGHGVPRSMRNPVCCCFSLLDGCLVRWQSVIDSTPSDWQHLVVTCLGVCCDPINGVVWTYGHGQVNEWADGGFPCLNRVKRQLCITDTPQCIRESGELMSPDDVRSSLTIHISMLCGAMDGTLNASRQAHVHLDICADMLLDSNYLKLICEVLHSSIAQKQHSIILCMLHALQPLLKLAMLRNVTVEEQVAKDLRSFVWMLVCSTTEKVRTQIQREACHVLVCGLGLFYPDAKEQSALVIILLTESDISSNGVHVMRDLLLNDMTRRLLGGGDGMSAKIVDDAVSKVLQVCMRESCRAILHCASLTEVEFVKFKAVHPAASPTLQYLTALVIKSWRTLMLSGECTINSSATEVSGAVIRQVEALMLAAKILDGCQQLLGIVMDVLRKLPSDCPDTLQSRLSGLEQVVKATLIGQLLPFLVTVMSNEKLCRLPLAKGFLTRVTNTTITATKAAHLFCTMRASCSESKVTTAGKPVLSSLTIPSPWMGPRRVDSIHPVRDDYKFTKTITISGAKCLYLQFDTRCATQYVYDKVSVHAGSDTSARKIGEFGGNSFGLGSRNVLVARLGWPKDLVKVEGDTVTFSFQVKSSRERPTPDEAVWGFACSVSSEENHNRCEVLLPVLADIALGLSVLTHNLLDVMYKGAQTTTEEQSCCHLLNSQLLQRCIWSTSETPSQDSEACGIKITVTEEHEERASSPLKGTSRSKISPDLIKSLRNASGILAPTLRPSIRQALQPEAIEEVTLSAVIRHLNLSAAVHGLVLLQMTDSESQEYSQLCDVMREVFRRLDGLLRQLQGMAELELRWAQEVKDIRQGVLQPSAAFFNEYHLQEVKAKELEILCYLKDAEFDPMELERVVGNLIRLLETDAKDGRDLFEDKDILTKMPKTRALRYSIMECGELLCSVTIHSAKKKSTPERSVSQGTFGPIRHRGTERAEERSWSPTFGRSLSAPSQLHHSVSVQEGVQDLLRLQRWRTAIQRKSNSAKLNHEGEGERKAFVTTVTEIFAFIGSDPERAVSCSSFLSAAHTRNERGLARVQALRHMREVVSACSTLTGHVPHLLTVVASVLAKGPRTEELKCGGVVNEVREGFSGVVQAVLQQATRDPPVYSDSIVLTSVCPYTWQDERCVIRSGLILLLDKLCVLRRDRTEASRKLSTMAWASFQALLKRFVQWETDKDYCRGEIEWSGLAYQVSVLMTNYLTCVLDETRADDMRARDSLQYVLQVLQNIARSKMGEAILQQPCIVSTLLSVLLDRRAPPKLVLTALKLCRVALPLMAAKSCEEVTLPNAAKRYLGRHTKHAELKPVLEVAKLLLTKLGDFILPTAQTEDGYKEDEELDGLSSEGSNDQEIGSEDDKETDSRLFSVCVHKRADQPAHEVVQKIISREGQRFIFRVGLGSEVERAVRIDVELSQYNKAEVMKGKFATCLAKGATLARVGVVTSIVLASHLHGAEGTGDEEGGSDPDAVCKARNIDLARETSRPFISGQVANTMATEIISLLHSLLSSPVSDTNKLWSLAVQEVLSDALEFVPTLIENLGEDIECKAHSLPVGDPLGAVEVTDEDETSYLDEESLFMSRQVIAALCALGGFSQTLPIGSQDKLAGEDMAAMTCEVGNVSERQGVATVLLDESAGKSYSERVQGIPLVRLEAPLKQIISLEKIGMAEKAIGALDAILHAREIFVPDVKEPKSDNAAHLRTLAVRVLCEIKTRASMVVAFQMKNPLFCDAFSCHQAHPIEILKSLAEDSDPGKRLPVVEGHCEELRKLFKDFVKPSQRKVSKKTRTVVLDVCRLYPPLRGVLFTEGFTSAHMFVDTNTGTSLPRGAYMYATTALPMKAPSYYWEVEIVSLGDAAIGAYGSSGSSVSIGLAPSEEGPVDRWSNAVGACMLHDNGIAVHYTRGGFTSWQTINTGVAIKKEDVVGCGYTRCDDHRDTGAVYFTHNGHRLAGDLDDVSAGLWPVVHVQKKDVRVRVNFGMRPFVYAKGSKIREAADLKTDSMEELRENFGMLPFGLDDERDNGKEEREEAGGSRDVMPLPKGVPKPLDLSAATEHRGFNLAEYDPSASLHYMLSSSCDVMIDVGPASHMVEDETNKQTHDLAAVNPVELLVKAWEDKVFPVIRRRFRSETDRRSGLEQIRGALIAGMMEIAVATVNDLYEDTGGIPNTLILPRLEDVKKDANKLAITNIKQGMGVIINGFTAASLPTFAVPGMKKTFGLAGIVHTVDKPQNAVEVETYNHEEGTLMRFWYPISALERPVAGQGRSSSLAIYADGDTTQDEAHRELLKCEMALTRLYSLTAYTELLRRLKSQSDKVSDTSLVQSLAIQILSPPQSDGGLTVTSPQSAPSPHYCLTACNLLPSVLFYAKPECLLSEVRQMLSSNSCMGEEVVHLTNTICQVLRDPTQEIWHRCFLISPISQEIELHFPKAAITVVSCRTNPAYLTGGWVNSKKPYVTVLCYYGGPKLNKRGNIARYKAVQYPFLDGPMPSFGHPGTYWKQMYPSRVLPCNRLCVRYEDGAVDGPIVDIHAMSPRVLLALLFIESFVAYFLENLKYTDQRAEAGEDITEVERAAVFNVIDILTCFTLNANLPAMIKEVVFHLLAQLLRANHKAETRTCMSPPQTYSAPVTLILTRLAPLKTELQKLLDKEVSVTNAAALEFILKCNFENDKFSSYLQALFELVLAMAEVTPPTRERSGPKRDRQGSITEALLQTNVSSLSEPADFPDMSFSPSSSTSPTFDFKGEEFPPTSSTDASTSVIPSSSRHQRTRTKRSSLRRRKRAYAPEIMSPTESMPWFENALSASLLLRNLLHREDRRGSVILNDSLSAVVSVKSSVLQRLLVITNIPKTMDKRAVAAAIKKACRPSGGIIEESIYIPEIASKKTSSDAEESGQFSQKGQESLGSLTQFLPSARTHKPDKIQGHAVVELRSGSQLDLARQAISANRALRVSTMGQESEVDVAKVNAELLMEGTNELVAFGVFDRFLHAKLCNHDQLNPPAREALMEIFTSCVTTAAFMGQESGNSTPLMLSRRGSEEQSRFRVRAVNSAELRTAPSVQPEELHCVSELASTTQERTVAMESVLDTEELCVDETGKSLEPKTTELERISCQTKPLVTDLQERQVKMTSKQATNSTASLSLSETELFAGARSSKEGRTAVEICSSDPTVGGTFNDSTSVHDARCHTPPVELVTEEQIFIVTPSNLLLTFFNTVRYGKQPTQELVRQVLRNHGVMLEDEGEKCLTAEGFIDWIMCKGAEGTRVVWKGILACGYDLSFARCTHVFPLEVLEDDKMWTLCKDTALVRYVDTLCLALSTSPSRLMPDEIHVTEADLTSENFYSLQDLPLQSIRSRFAFLKSLNQTIERLLLPVTDLRTARTHSTSTAALLRDARGLMFYDTKIAFLKRMLDHSNHRGSSYISPEISLDPLETLEADKVSSSGPQFHQAARYLASVTSAGLRVKVATGGDPTFPLRVHLRGEQVLGSGGSFRHFMWLMARELQGPHVALLIPCPSSAANINKGKYILKPGPMSYSEEKLLIFFGQLLGIALRSDIPLAVDLMPVFWRSLLGLPLDPKEDIHDTDILTYNYIRRFSEVQSREEFNTLCFEADLCPYRFVYTSLRGDEIELCPNGANTPVTWENHREYVDAIRNLRLREFRCASRMAAILCGLYSVIPLPVLSVMSPSDMEMRTCGMPTLDLDFLKAHTTYVAGVRETDSHIEYFWNTMENFSQDQLRKFVKFACNQERLPSRCTCQEGNPNTADVHVPPYPMKIGPPDDRGRSDARYIRVETCMFMVKLPQYSTQEIMNQNLLYAINCREDPLTDL